MVFPAHVPKFYIFTLYMKLQKLIVFRIIPEFRIFKKVHRRSASIRLGFPLKNLRGHRLEHPNNDRFLSMKIIFTLTNSGDPDKMLHMGFHCMSTHSFTGFQLQINPFLHEYSC